MTERKFSKSPSSSDWSQVLSSEPMRQVIHEEVVGMYADALVKLGIPEEDVARNAELVRNSRLSVKKIETVYAIKRAADVHGENGTNDGVEKSSSTE